MRSALRASLVGGVALATAFATQAGAAPAEYKVTGGGQIFATFGAGSDGGSLATFAPADGAGDTIVFQARSTDGVPSGRVQIIDRTGGTGKNHTKFVGEVTCLQVTPSGEQNGGVAKIGVEGVTTREGGTQVPAKFELYLTDGYGATEQDDTIAILEPEDGESDNTDQTPDEPDCDYNTPTAAEYSRGNVQIHKAKA